MQTPNENTCRLIVNQRSLGLCEVRIPRICTALGESDHHRFKPGRVWLPSNVVKTCGDGTRGCHGWIEANPTDAHLRGLWLFAGEKPPATPLIMAWRGVMDWYYLTDAGGISWPGYDKDALPPLVSP